MKRIISVILAVFILFTTFVPIYADDKEVVEIVDLATAIAASKNETIVDNVRLTHYEGLTVKLQYYNYDKKEWQTKLTIKPTNEYVKIKYPNEWKKHLTSYWRVLIPETKNTAKYVSDQITFVLQQYKTPKLKAKSYALIEANTGRVVASNNTYKKYPMASTTKLMTALLVFEHCKMDDVVTITKTTVNTECSSMDFKVGEKYYVKTLLHALLLKSSNDSATALAVHVGGSLKNFVRMMNKRAKELDMRYTQFKNPHGLDTAGHYSSAYDMSLLNTYLLEYRDFLAIEQTKTYTVKTIKNKRPRKIETTNKLLGKYPGIISGKTGLTTKAGRPFTAAFKYKGKTYCYTLLGCKNVTERFQEAKKLMDYVKKYS